MIILVLIGIIAPGCCFSFKIGRLFYSNLTPAEGSESDLTSTEVYTQAERSFEDDNLKTKRQELNSRLFSLSAVCDRCFASSPSDRNTISNIVTELTNASPIASPSYGLYPNNFTTSPCPIEGKWRLVYTTALDVLSLNASPVTLLQGIYQVIGSSLSFNIIDLAPRIQSAFPPALIGLGSTLRLKVYTSVYARTPTRVGLKFLSVEVKPITAFGMRTEYLPPLRAPLPQVALYQANLLNEVTGP